MYMIYAYLLVYTLFVLFWLLPLILGPVSLVIHNGHHEYFGGEGEETISKSLREILYVIYLNINNAF